MPAKHPQQQQHHQADNWKGAAHAKHQTFHSSLFTLHSSLFTFHFSLLSRSATCSTPQRITEAHFRSTIGTPACRGPALPHAPQIDGQECPSYFPAQRELGLRPRSCRLRASPSPPRMPLGRVTGSLPDQIRSDQIPETPGWQPVSHPSV